MTETNKATDDPTVVPVAPGQRATTLCQTVPKLGLQILATAWFLGLAVLVVFSKMAVRTAESTLAAILGACAAAVCVSAAGRTFRGGISRFALEGRGLRCSSLLGSELVPWSEVSWIDMDNHLEVSVGERRFRVARGRSSAAEYGPMALHLWRQGADAACRLRIHVLWPGTLSAGTWRVAACLCLLGAYTFAMVGARVPWDPDEAIGVVVLAILGLAAMAKAWATDRHGVWLENHGIRRRGLGGERTLAWGRMEVVYVAVQSDRPPRHGRALFRSVEGAVAVRTRPDAFEAVAKAIETRCGHCFRVDDQTGEILAPAEGGVTQALRKGDRIAAGVRHRYLWLALVHLTAWPVVIMLWVAALLGHFRFSGCRPVTLRTVQDDLRKAREAKRSWGRIKASLSGPYDR